MSPEVLKALQRSIEVWELKLLEDNPSNIKMGTDNCPLCIHFQNNEKQINCGRCPVFNKTNKLYCKNTPYEEVYIALSQWIDDYNTNESYSRSKVFKEKVQKEINFLKSLLPEEHKNVSAI